jgi:protein SCO1/2
MRGGGFALCAILLAAGAARAEKTPIVFPQGAEQPLAALQDIDVIEHLGDRVPAGLKFSDEAGNPVGFDRLLGQGKPILVTLGYHRCPMLCGLVLDGLVKASRASGLKLGKDFFAIDISIDPSEDAKLLATTQKRVLALAGSDKPADWPFWTSVADGGAAARTLADAVGFRYKFDETSKQFAHDAVAFVLTPDGVIARYLYGVDYPARDFRMAVVEASGGRVGTSFDKVLMSCYRYDPATRRYAPFVVGFMRIGASVCFLALVGLLAVLWRKEIAMKKQRQNRTPADGTPPRGPLLDDGRAA